MTIASSFRTEFYLSEDQTLAGEKVVNVYWAGEQDIAFSVDDLLPERKTDGERLRKEVLFFEGTVEEWREMLGAITAVVDFVDRFKGDSGEVEPVIEPKLVGSVKMRDPR